MAAVDATLNAIDEDRLIENTRAVEKYLRESLKGIATIAGVRGVGLLLGIEFFEPIAAEVQRELLKRQIITGTSSDAHVLRLLPPLCVSIEEAEMFVQALREISGGSAEV